MIYLCSSLTESYFEKSIPYFDSISKNFPFNIVIFCLDFSLTEDQKLRWKKINWVSLESSSIDFKKDNEPNNRDAPWCMFAGGVWAHKHIEHLNDTDILIFSDVDMTMQREITSEELNIINSLDDKTFLNYTDGNDETVPLHLPEALIKGLSVHPNDLEGVYEYFGGRENIKGLRVNAGFSIARISAWKMLYDEIFPVFLDLVGSVLRGHASIQWIWSWVLNNSNNLSWKLLPDDFHNAHWFCGGGGGPNGWGGRGQPLVQFDGEYLRANYNIVLFAHTKFEINPKFGGN